jgi:hypothetical protein
MAGRIRCVLLVVEDKDINVWVVFFNKNEREGGKLFVLYSHSNWLPFYPEKYQINQCFSENCKLHFEILEPFLYLQSPNGG